MLSQRQQFHRLKKKDNIWFYNFYLLDWEINWSLINVKKYNRNVPQIQREMGFTMTLELFSISIEFCWMDLHTTKKSFGCINLLLN